jgi:hypothetical protein
MRRFVSFFVLFVMVAASAMAGLINVIPEPSTSAAWPTGTNFDGEISATTDPLGPFSDTSIQFRGWNSGGSQISLNSQPCSNSNACLVFLYELDFAPVVGITSISFTGDAFNGATFQLLNSSDMVIDHLSVSSGNVGHPVTYTMLTPGANGTTFFLALYDTSSTWTFVSDITGTTIPEPATYSMVLASLGVIAWMHRRRRHPHSQKRA